MATLVRSHRQIEVYKLAMFLADQNFHHTHTVPHDDRYSLTDQITRSSRSVTSNLVKTRPNRRYEAAFTSKPNDADATAAETRTRLEHAVRRDSLPFEPSRSLFKGSQRTIDMPVTMPRHSNDRVIHS